MVWVGDEIVAKKRANTVATLERMAAPMLIVAADADLLAPPALMRIWAAHVKQREWTVVYEAGHAIAWEQPAVERPALRHMAVADLAARVQAVVVVDARPAAACRVDADLFPLQVQG